MNLRDLITEDLVLPNMVARDKRAAIHELVEFLREQKKMEEEEARKIEIAVMRRESKGTTGIGKGVAIPHTKNCAHVGEIVAALGISREGIPFAALDGEPVNLVFLVASSKGSEAEHLQVMRKIAHLARDEKTNRFLASTEDFSSLGDILAEVDEHFQRK
jgi:PTS system fructose-specific IIA component/PTS system nitrogen regulatory IIA component